MKHDFDTSIINIANDFYNAYLRCIEGKNERKDEYGRICYDVANIPAIVNGAFAIELYLKSILESKGIKYCTKNGHSIRYLYKRLDKDNKTIIRNEVEKQLFNNESFDDCLSIIDNAFSYWRYVHEKANLGYGLNKTLNMLPVFIESIRYVANFNGHIG